ncbi:MAG TPA: thioredoxin domain-containing protein [Anaerolineales bacterium]|nr:thioredoxin domain-containing protein [Anaerolineales bacterium]
MKLGSLLRILLLLPVLLACILPRAPATSEAPIVDAGVDQSPAPESFTLILPHPSQGDLPALLAAHAQRAAELNRKPFVEFSADWCPPCLRLAESLGDPRMVEAFRGVYLIRLDFDEWKSRLGSTGFIVLGVPTFFELGPDGRSTGRTITGAAWGADIPENMAPVLQGFFRGSR